jgi:ankyrin repeat protein
MTETVQYNDEHDSPWQLGRELAEAVARGDAESVAELLRRKADTEAVEETDDPTPLFLAAESGRFDLVLALVEAGANVNTVATEPDLEERFGRDVAEVVDLTSPLLYAGLKGHRAVYDYLAPRTELRLRAMVEKTLQDLDRLRKPKRNNRGIKSVLEAVQRGDLETVRQKLAAGFDVNAQNKTGSTPLSMAVAVDQREIAKFLIEHGADPNIATNEGLTPLHCAQTPESVRALVAAGARIDTRERYGRTPLHFAVRQSKELVTALLELGAVVDAADDNGETPLMSAGEMGTAGAIAALLAAGANLRAKDEDGRTAYGRACHRSFHKPDLEVIRILREAGAVPANDLALLHAADGGQVELMQSLLASGADVNICDPLASDPEFALTPLHAAAASGHDEAARALIAAGANLEALTDNYGRSQRRAWTPLMLAASSGQAGMIRLLAEAGADPEGRTLDGAEETPLMRAASAGHTEACRALIDVGANPRRTAWGHTAAELAQQAGHRELARVLFSHSGTS